MLFDGRNRIRFGYSLWGCTAAMVARRGLGASFLPMTCTMTASITTLTRHRNGTSGRNTR